MPVIYEQARELARAAREPGWTFGTFCIDDRVITETDEYYVIKLGAREFLVDGDDSYQIFGATTVVYKEDGRVAGLPSAAVATDPTIKRRPNPTPTLDV